MTMHDGQTIYLSFAVPCSTEGKPKSFVSRAVVIDAENGVVRRSNGIVAVIDPRGSVERVHATEAEAWASNAAALAAAAAVIEEESRRCVVEAAKAAAFSRTVA